MANELTGVFANVEQPSTIDQYKESERLQALIQICWDGLEAMTPHAYDIAACVDLATSIGDQLDQVGGAFGIDRQSRSDDDYRKAIYARISYQGHGTVEEILDSCRKVFGGVNMEYLPELPAKFFVWLQDATGDTSFANKFLNRIAPAGVQAMHAVNLVTATNPQPIHTATTDERIFVVKQDTV